MDAFENMSKRTKIILSIIGISAVLVPTALLMFVSQNTLVPPQANDAPRQIDQIDVRNQKDVIPTPPPVLVPTPSPVIATPPPAASGSESTSSSR